MYKILIDSTPKKIIESSHGVLCKF